MRFIKDIQDSCYSSKFPAFFNGLLGVSSEFHNAFARLGHKGLFLFLLFSCSPSFSQEHESIISNDSAPEKIYLQLGSKFYGTDQTIWFKAIVTDSESNMPTDLSGVLHVELLDPNGQIKEHNLVQLTQGIGSGYFELQTTYDPGRYLIRAYTQWNLNFGRDFMFKAYVNVFSVSDNHNNGLIEGLTLIEQDSGLFLLTAELKPQNMEGDIPKEIRIYLDWGGVRDSISVKKNSKGMYLLSYEVPEKLDWVNLSMDAGNRIRHTATIVLSDASLHTQFFPESGPLVHGFRNKVGFKTVGIDGMGKSVNGVVLNQIGDELASFESNHLGMGYFYLEADSSSSYYAKVHPRDQIDSTVTFPLPKVVSRGSILSVSKAEDMIHIQVMSSTNAGRISIKVSCRGVLYYLIEGPLRDGRLVYELPSDGLPEGIIDFTLLDSNNIPVAERLYYNESKREWLDLKLSTNKPQYRKREKTEIKILVSEADSISAKIDLSVMVISKQHWHQGLGETIRSFFLLGSELRGEIESPDYYFRKGKPGLFDELEALMLTQGWRNYKYPVTHNGAKHYLPQSGLTVNGKVNSPSRKRTKIGEMVDLSLITFGEETAYYDHQTDSTGKFHFLLEDAYGQHMRILLQAIKQEKKERNYTISLDSIRAPEVHYQQKPTVPKSDKAFHEVMKAHQTRVETEASFRALYGITELDEVVVEGFRLTADREKANQRFGEPEVIINGDAIRQKEKSWSFGLYSILLYNYRDQVVIRRLPNGFRMAQVQASGPTLIAVDGRLLRGYEYNQVARMSVDFIESVEIIKGVKSFRKNWLEAFPQSNVVSLPVGNIISVYTKNRVGMYARGTPLPGTLVTTIDVFSPHKEFYSPVYQNLVSSGDPKPDLRSLIHWTPSVEAQQTGRISESFYNGDITGEYVIIVEAISQDGRIGYQEQTYQVVY